MRRRTFGLLAISAAMFGPSLAAMADAPQLPPAPPPLAGKISRNFGFKTAWIAFRSSDLGAVAAALKLREPRWMAWPDGIAQAYRGSDIAVTPAIDGWILATGTILLEKLPDPRRGFKGLADFAHYAALSRSLGEVQFFATQRVSDAHQWHRFFGGKESRQFCIGDGKIYVNGAETEIEKQILHARGPGVPAISENDVMKIAGAWSIDPSRLDEAGYRRIAGTHVLVGRID